jgi:hypothetical protein
MAIPNQILDGSPQYGTSNLTIGGTTYICNNIACTMTWTSAENQTAAGLPYQKRWTRGRWQFSTELQIATSGTPYPVSGTTFSYQPPNETSALTFVVLEVPFNATNSPGEIRVINMTAEEARIGITTA